MIIFYHHTMKQDPLREAFSRIKQDITKQNSIIEQLMNKISSLEQENLSLKQQILNNQKRQKEDPIEKEIISQISTHRSRFIKSKIIEQISLGSITTSRLKQIIVTEKKYCSKSTFYRYLSELNDSIVTVKKGNETYLMLRQHLPKVNND